MPISYQIRDDEILVITPTGTTNLAQWTEVFSSLLNEPYQKSVSKLLVDVRTHESVVPTEFVHTFTQTIEAKETTTKMALVINTLVSKGMSNMISVMLENKNIRVMHFKDIAEAEAWLMAPQNR